MADATEILRCDDIAVSYGKVRAVHGVSLSLQKGQIATLIGPNGAGKSSILSALMGLLPYSGDIAFSGNAVPRRSNVETRVSMGLGLVPETRELFGEMTVRDNLILGAFSRYIRGEKDMAEPLKRVFGLFPRLQERQGQVANTLSGGERQMLALGRALMSRPVVLMLDEPSLGLAPLVCRSIFSAIRQLCDDGISILLVEQNARAALKIADYAYVLEGGEVRMEGTAVELARSSRVIESYLGLGATS
ncbi:MAG: ABC transporter ATP-binding protein [Pseudorhodoplanes sp.]|uniref:ABC transporter ATP-binding protein n=1 Tax=Pseudorhodoplanes sp. TaxID=1934341 RepID=UPI003D0DC9F9